METPQENTETSLIDLTGHCDEKIVALLSRSIRGYQTILNLRRVCRATKSWVDLPQGLSLHEGRLVFSELKTVMKADFESLFYFIEYPVAPNGRPRGISTLSLDISPLPDGNLDPSYRKFWDQFTAYWTPILTELELRSSKGTQKFNSHVRTILNSPGLQFIRLPTLNYTGVSLESLPKSLFNVTELWVSRLSCMSKYTKTRFYFELGRNRNLRKFHVSLDELHDLQCLMLLMWKKQGNNFFLDISDVDAILGKRRRRVSETFQSQLIKFASCITVYPEIIVTIHLKYGLRFIRLMDRIFEENEGELANSFNIMTKFLGRIESIERPLYCEKLYIYEECLRNLKSVRIRSDVLQNTLPEDLHSLWLYDFNYPQRTVTPNLKILHLFNLKIILRHFLTMVEELTDCCPLLETLQVEWNAEPDIAHWGPSSKRYEFIDYENPRLFNNLKSFSFGAKLHFKIARQDYDELLNESRLEAVRIILLQGFRIGMMKLTHLKLFKDMSLKKNPHYSVLDSEILEQVIEGNSRNSLVTVGVQKTWVTKDGLPVLAKLESIAKENWTYRTETEGRGDWMRFSS